MQGTTAEEKIHTIIAHVMSLKDIIASGFRCPSLVAASLEKVPREHREAVVELDKQLKALLAACNHVHLRSGGSSASAVRATAFFASPPAGGNHKSSSSPSAAVVVVCADDDEIVMDSGPVITPARGVHNDINNHLTSPVARQSSLSHSVAAAATSSSAVVAAGTRAEGTNESSSDCSTNNNNKGNRMSLSASPPSSVASQFRCALLGVADEPKDIGEERFPKSLITGLVHGNDRPFRALLLSHKSLLDGLFLLLEGPKHDALSFANMMWVQHHPADFEAQAIEATRMKAHATRAQHKFKGSSGGGNNSSSNHISNGGVGGVGGNSQPSHAAGISSSSSSESSTAARMESIMRHLLLLNLQLKHAPHTWAPMLRIRDDTLSSARTCRNVFDAVVIASNVAVTCFPSIVRVYNTLDALLAGLSHINIYIQPTELDSLLLDRFTTTLVEAQVVMHDHEDVNRNAKLCEALRECVEQVISLMKEALRSLSEMECSPHS